MMGYLGELQQVADNDVRALKKAEQSYGDSWKKRGGVGAFMMLARKWDRLEKQVAAQSQDAGAYDIFSHILADARPEGVIDDIRDLRRYLMLVEAEMRARGGETEEVAKSNELSLDSADYIGGPMVMVKQVEKERGTVRLDDTGEPGRGYIAQD